MLSTSKVSFISDLTALWDSLDGDSTIYDTADLIESFWGNAEISGHTVPPSSPAVVTPKITYSSFSALSGPNLLNGPAVAAIFESALSTMVLSTILFAIPPAITSGIPIPILPEATPGALTSSLSSIFSVQNSVSVSLAVAKLISGYLQGWSINVAIPPAAATPLLIV